MQIVLITPVKKPMASGQAGLLVKLAHELYAIPPLINFLLHLGLQILTNVNAFSYK